MSKNLGMLALIMAFGFTSSFITNILGPLIPDIIHNFNLSDLAMAGFIPTSFFLAYAIMSIPCLLYTSLLNNDKSNVNWYILRYADVLLMYAEALNEWHHGPNLSLIHILYASGSYH